MSLLDPGTKLGAWTIEDKLGGGGHGDVYRALNDSGEIGALKVLRDPRSQHTPYKRFAREVETLRTLGVRDGVLPLLDSSVPDAPGKRERVWYVMPVANPLKSTMTSKSTREIVTAIRDLALVLSALQFEYDIAHRDLKPENLYWWNDGPAVGDFGLVEMPNQGALTETGRVPGAFGYIADELFLNRDSAGGPADVFSISKVLWVLLTPDSTFPPQGALRADNGPASLARTLVDNRAHELDEILESSTRHVNDRITMDQLAAELDSWLSAPTAEHPKELQLAIGAARQSMAPSRSSRELAAQRSEQARQAQSYLSESAADIMDLLRQVDRQAQIGPGAISKYTGQLQETEYIGGPAFDPPLVYGGCLRRVAGAIDVVLVIAFSLQSTPDGACALNGFMSSGFEDVMGGFYIRFEQREAPLGSIRLKREIDHAVQDAREALPQALEEFADKA